MKRIIIWCLLTVMTVSLAGCGLQNGEARNTNEDNAVASGEEMAEAVDVVEEGMEPVDGSQIKDGTYPIKVDSSSTMFSIESCELTADGGKMTAKMKMGGTGYKYVYMGTAEEAAADSGEGCIGYEEGDEGAHIFTVPVEALDEGIDCAAFSKKKEKWYARTLVFRADSLPEEAYIEGFFVTAGSLGLSDGEYTASVVLEGGSGKAGVESPAKIKVQNGECTATLVWSSSNYDYMKIGGVKYEAQLIDGHSVFEVPVSRFDKAFAVIADTVAMSEPHEIEYTLRFDSASISPVK